MRQTLYIAWRYVAFNRVKSAVLVVSIACILYVPLALRVLVAACERKLMSRAVATPLLLGAKGSSLDLAIDTLYFEPRLRASIRMAEVGRIRVSGLAEPIPLDTRFRARGHTIVGTTLEYFAFRRLSMADGRSLNTLGECVLGAAVARKLDLLPGNALVSSPENPFDLAGTYPLKMNVVGVLETAHSPDDEAIFVDIRTAWIIAGLGHGHVELDRVDDTDVLLKKEGTTYTANAKLRQYNEITDENVDRFHIHGLEAEFPISAVIAVPPDRKSGDLLRGRYQDDGATAQAIRPAEVIRALTATIFRVEGFVNGVFGLLAAATFLLIVLIVTLSLRLRQREMQMLFKLGCSRSTVAALVLAELAIIVLASGAATVILTWITARFADEILRTLVLS